MRLLTAVLVASIAIGCAPSADDDLQSASGEINEGKSASWLERRLERPIPVPTGTPIGRRMDDVVAELTRGAVADAPVVDEAGCTRTLWRKDGVEVLSRRTCERWELVSMGKGKRFYQDPGDKEGKRDGRVHAFQDETEGLYQVSDTNYDGRVDKVIESAARIPGLSIAPFGATCALRRRLGSEEEASIANRIQEDKDFDGRFETESITAKNGFFVCAKPADE